MNLDDESLLTAYLDGALAPRELVCVEEALRTDPRLVQRLAELARVRELIAGLSRPQPPFDLSQAIVAQLASSPVRPRGRVRLGAWQTSYVDVALAAAAVFLAAGFVGYLAVLRDLHAPRPLAEPAAVPVAAAPATLPAPVVVERPKTRPEPIAVVRKAQGGSRREAGADLAADDQAQFQAMIDSPNLKRVFFVVDTVGGRGDERVGNLVKSMSGADSVYACMTIVPDVVVDPKHPGAAKVYAVALTDPELEQVRNQLRTTFPNAVEESDPDASVVTQLADIGQVSVLPGTAVADLESPAETDLRIDAVKGRLDPNAASDAAPRVLPSGPTPEQLLSAPSHYVDRHQPRSGDAPAAVARGAESRPGQAPARERVVAAPERPRRNKANVVLIWVASR